MSYEDNDLKKTLRSFFFALFLNQLAVWGSK